MLVNSSHETESRLYCQPEFHCDGFDDVSWHRWTVLDCGMINRPKHHVLKYIEIHAVNQKDVGLLLEKADMVDDHLSTSVFAGQLNCGVMSRMLSYTPRVNSGSNSQLVAYSE